MSWMEDVECGFIRMNSKLVCVKPVSLFALNQEET